MAEQFLHLGNQERREILETLASQLGRDAKVLEKDVWVCWVLSVLFSMPGAHRMAFKGGTSLSKIYATINRFSEDIDVTVDYQELAKAMNDDFDPFADGQSRNQIRKFSERLREAVKVYALTQIVPHLRAELNKFPNASEHRLVVSDDGQDIYVYYPSEIAGDDYMLDNVKIELGGRNVINPNETHRVTADLSEHIKTLEFPSCDEVVALSAERTFWEKVTLVHALCSRGEFKETPDRLSRHWYDLHVLLQTSIAQNALEDEELLRNVVAVKKCFFHTGHANYDACLNNAFVLTPTPEMVSALKVDYAKMRVMIYDESPSFDTIIQALSTLESQLNS